MIKLSDIKVTTSKQPIYRDATVVTARYERTEEMVISPDEARRRPDIVGRIEKAIPGRLLERVYGDLRDPLCELEHIALMSRCVDPQRVRELIGQIHAIMEGRG